MKGSLRLVVRAAEGSCRIRFGMRVMLLLLLEVAFLALVARGEVGPNTMAAAAAEPANAGVGTGTFEQATYDVVSETQAAFQRCAAPYGGAGRVPEIHAAEAPENLLQNPSFEMVNLEAQTGQNPLPGWWVSSALWRQQDVEDLTASTVSGQSPVHGSRFIHVRGGVRAAGDNGPLFLRQRVRIAHRLAQYTLGFWVQTMDLDMQAVRITLQLFDSQGRALPMNEEDAVPGQSMGKGEQKPRTECMWMTFLGFHKFRFHWMEIPVGPWPSSNHTDADSVEISFMFGGPEGRGDFLGHVFLDDVTLTLNPTPLLELSPDNDEIASVFRMDRRNLNPPPAKFHLRVASTVPVATLQSLDIVVYDIQGKPVHEAKETLTLRAFDDEAFMGARTPSVQLPRRLGYFEVSVSVHQTTVGSETLAAQCAQFFDRTNDAHRSFMVVDPPEPVHHNGSAELVSKVSPRFASWAFRTHYIKTLPLVGLQWTRSVVMWRAREPKKGRIVIPWTALYNAAQNEMVVLVTFAEIPHWASSAGERDPAYHVSPPKDYGDFAYFIKRTLQRYADYHATVGAVEVFNEPVRPWGWAGTLQELIQMHKTAYQTVKAYNPAIPVLGPCFSPMDVLPRLRELMAVGLGEWIDGVTIHVYPLSLRYPRERGFREWLQSVRAMMLSYDMADDGLWLSEIGWHVEAANGFDELDQAHSLAQVYVMCVVESVDMCEWHNFADFRVWEKTTSPHGIMINSEEGLFRAKIPLAPDTPRPSAYVFSRVRVLLDGATFLYELDWLATSGASGYVLRTKTGDAMIALLGPQDGAIPVQLPACVGTDQLSVLLHYTYVHHAPVRTVSAAADQVGVGTLLGGPVQCLRHQQDADAVAGHVRVASVLATKAVAFVTGLDSVWLTGRSVLHVKAVDGASVPWEQRDHVRIHIDIAKMFVHHDGAAATGKGHPQLGSNHNGQSPLYALRVVHHGTAARVDVPALHGMAAGASIQMEHVLDLSGSRVLPGAQKVFFELVETLSKQLVAKHTLVLDLPPANSVVDVETCTGNLLYNPSFEMGKDRWYPYGFDDHGQTTTLAFNGLGAWEMQGMLPRYAEPLILKKKASLGSDAPLSLEDLHIATTQRVTQRVALVPGCATNFSREGISASVWIRSTSPDTVVFIGLESCPMSTGQCKFIRGPVAGKPGIAWHYGKTPDGNWFHLHGHLLPERIPPDTLNLVLNIGRRGPHKEAERVVLDDIDLHLLTAEERAHIRGQEVQLGTAPNFEAAASPPDPLHPKFVAVVD